MLHGLTTGIGSLPQESSEEALDLAFSVDIPFLPQLPRLRAGEGLIEQALSGDSAACDAFFERARNKRAPALKLQIAGPVTLSTFGPSRIDVETVILSNALPLLHRAQSIGADVLFFVDEPALARSVARPSDSLETLSSILATLKRDGARVGLHCCGEAEWDRLFTLPLDLLSFDAQLSLRSIFETGAILERFIDSGGRLAPGIVPTNGATEVDAIARSFVDACAPFPAALRARLLRESIFTPACGLAGAALPDANRILSTLREAATRIAQAGNN